MKKLTLFLMLWAVCSSAFAQVTAFQSSASSRYWLNFMFSNNKPNGDLLYYKSRTQPTSGVNSYNVVIGRYNMASSTETMTITLTGIEGGSASYFIPGMNGLVTDNSGNIYVGSYGSAKVYRFNAPVATTGNVDLSPAAIYTLPAAGSNVSLAFDGSSNLYMSNQNGNLYKVLAANLSSSATLTTAFLTVPSFGIYDIDFDGPNNIYLSGGGTEIKKYSLTGTYLSSITYSAASTNIFSAAVSQTGVVYFTTGNNKAIAKFDPSNSAVTIYAGASGVTGDALDASTTAPYTAARFNRVTNITLGGNGLLMAFDESNSKVYKIVTNTVEATLPLYLTAFTATNGLTATNYSWSMASQQDVVNYLLEQSTDGKEFKQFATIAPVAQQGKYSYSNTIGNEGKYVRLKILYGTGEEEFSEIKYIKGKLSGDFQASISRKTLNIKCDIPGEYTIKLINLGGNVVFNKKVSLYPGINTVGLTGSIQPSTVYVIDCVSSLQHYTSKTIAN